MQSGIIRPARRFVVLALVVAVAVAADVRVLAQRPAREASPFAVDATTTILLGADESPAIAAAVDDIASDDLASDLKNVLGRKPPGYLGIDPLYFWTDRVPERRRSRSRA